MEDNNIAYAGFWRRTGALMIDNAIFGVLLLTLVMLVHIPHRLLEMVYQPTCLLYFVMLESAPGRQATIGKWCMKIYVATKDGQCMHPGLALWRYMTWILPMVPAIAIDSSPVYTAVLDAVHGYNMAGDRTGLVKYMEQPGVTEMLMTYVAAGAGGLTIWGLWCIPSMIFGKQKAGVHDLATGTRVFRKIM